MKTPPLLPICQSADGTFRGIYSANRGTGTRKWTVSRDRFVNLCFQGWQHRLGVSQDVGRSNTSVSWHPDKFLKATQNSQSKRYIYIMSRSTTTQAAILCQQISTVKLNMDLLRVSWYQPDITSCMRKVWDEVGHQKPKMNFRVEFHRWIFQIR